MKLSKLVDRLPCDKGRSPCGERGLKFRQQVQQLRDAVSLPVRGAWIEIRRFTARKRTCRPSLPVRGAWIEMSAPATAYIPRRSLPVRGAWIEIRRALPRWMTRACRSPCGERGLKFSKYDAHPESAWVAPRAGSVD